MPPAPLPADEAKRLQTLHESGLLSTGSDMRLDALVQRAAIAFEMTIAAISLLDESRQVFKASIGLGMPFTARDLAFCGYTILGTEPMVVQDASSDHRFADNALVTGDPGLRFYAGSPVYGPGRQPIGALCVMDTRAARATPEQLATLKQLADAVSQVFTNPPSVDLKRERTR